MEWVARLVTPVLLMAVVVRSVPLVPMVQHLNGHVVIQCHVQLHTYVSPLKKITVFAVCEINHPRCSRHAHRAVSKCIPDSVITVVTAYSVPHRTSAINWEDAASLIYKGQQASGLVCTYSSCSNTNPCSTGTCNNGYCCSSGSVPSYAAVATRKRKPRSAQTNSTTNEVEENDWPIGPPGYGFPHHLADLDAVLVKAAGDGSALHFNSLVPLATPLIAHCTKNSFRHMCWWF
ncbi:unnamed protein product [Cylicostephanus goldi]|uniref:WAP domain-containing protein n=1 Tax=Cylicostephanus goldi TaxID=71465 RepID=A0A3P7M614_CYLGO|nr:unnamed protein product [Cylicostephanus goldi]